LTVFNGLNLTINNPSGSKYAILPIVGSRRDPLLTPGFDAKQIQMRFSDDEHFFRLGNYYRVLGL
jgi:hypothetical protein